MKIDRNWRMLVAYLSCAILLLTGTLIIHIRESTRELITTKTCKALKWLSKLIAVFHQQWQSGDAKQARLVAMGFLSCADMELCQGRGCNTCRNHCQPLHRCMTFGGRNTNCSAVNMECRAQMLEHDIVKFKNCWSKYTWFIVHSLYQLLQKGQVCIVCCELWKSLYQQCMVWNGKMVVILDKYVKKLVMYKLMIKHMLHVCSKIYIPIIQNM